MALSVALGYASLRYFGCRHVGPTALGIIPLTIELMTIVVIIAIFAPAPNVYSTGTAFNSV